MSKLVSRWADDPELVEEAKKQDHSKSSPNKSQLEDSKWASPIPSQKGKALESKWASPVTSEKGKPLVSKWADAPEEKDTSPTKNQNKHPKKHTPRKHNKQEDHVELSQKFENNLQLEDEEDDDRLEMSPEARKFASRLGISADNGQSSVASKPKIQFKNEPKYQPESEGDEWEDEEENDDEEEELEAKPVPPTKAAKDLASRLGVTIDDKKAIRNKREEERNNLKNERISARREWDHGKNSHTKPDQRSKRESPRKHDRFTKPRAEQTQSKPEPEYYEPEPMTEAKRKEQQEHMERLDYFIANHQDLDWADFDDDDF